MQPIVEVAQDPVTKFWYVWEFRNKDWVRLSRSYNSYTEANSAKKTRLKRA